MSLLFILLFSLLHWSAIMDQTTLLSFGFYAKPLYMTYLIFHSIVSPFSKFTAKPETTLNHFVTYSHRSLLQLALTKNFATYESTD